MKKHGKLVHLGIGIGFGAFFLWFALRDVDPGKLWECLKSVRLWTLGPMLALLVLFFWLKAIRWSLLLRPLRPEAPLRVREVVPAMMIGFMGNNVLPAHLGEFLRMYVLGKQHSLSKTAVLSTIVLERVLDFLAIIGTFAVILQFLPDVGPDLEERMDMVEKAGLTVGIASFVVFLAFLAFVWRTELALRWMEIGFGVLPGRLRTKLLAMARLGVEGLYSLRSPRALLAILVLTAVHWSLNGFIHYLASVSFLGGSRLPVGAAFLLLSVTALGVTLPSAPGYVGILQACFVVALGVYGIGPEVAVAASFYALVVGWVPVTLVGFWFLGRLGMRLGALSREAEQETEVRPARATER